MGISTLRGGRFKKRPYYLINNILHNYSAALRDFSHARSEDGQGGLVEAGEGGELHLGWAPGE